ncbi:hypothetical protein [Winogradskyella vincentii]|uniref:Tetratricopeptide repeat-containing protein n=1 Tax=Winogradskyella vincentii TaxID=2877122 RepID=A0ABS7Y0P1_9FLAO|nr:hypothetical protein [Winogradskyella vincentii]MCA0153484.1 hypothetical protein [Winogradskyella vincentii]
MKELIIMALLVVTGMTQAQTNYEKGMAKAFQLWEADQWDEAENLFVRISNAEENEWLPNYYVAFMNSLKSWNVKDEAILKAQLDKAQEHLDIAMTKSENNPELMVMQAQVLTNWIAYDGMTYGMKYSGKVSELYSKAYAIAPENPRVAYCKASWAMGSARYFGQDTKPFCASIEATIELFDTFKGESEFHPKWGKDRAEGDIAANCKE